VKRPVSLLVALAAVAALASAVAALALPPSSYTVAMGRPIRQDDFTYTVVGFAKAPEVGMGRDAVRSRGIFYLVTIQVDNDARIVSFDWDPGIARIVDDRGRRYAYSVDGQRAIDASSGISDVVGHGDSRRFVVAFDLPPDIRRPAVAFSNGVMMGDVFDGASYARARVPLD
jgi:hypothetical protein